MIRRLSDAAQKAAKRIRIKEGKEQPGDKGDDDKEEEKEEEVDRDALEKDVKKYEDLWSEFGKALKLGTLRPSLLHDSYCHSTHLNPTIHLTVNCFSLVVVGDDKEEEKEEIFARDALEKYAGLWTEFGKALALGALPAFCVAPCSHST
jgi:HSP90 family molecular chaperone